MTHYGRPGSALGAGAYAFTVAGWTCAHATRPPVNTGDPVMLIEFSTPHATAFTQRVADGSGGGASASQIARMRRAVVIFEGNCTELRGPRACPQAEWN